MNCVDECNYLDGFQGRWMNDSTKRHSSRLPELDINHMASLGLLVLNSRSLSKGLGHLHAGDDTAEPRLVNSLMHRLDTFLT
jgi:hypothetical protein